MLQTLEGHSHPVYSVALSPDGKQVVSGFHDIIVRLWDAVTGAALQTLEGHSRPVYLTSLYDYLPHTPPYSFFIASNGPLLFTFGALH